VYIKNNPVVRIVFYFVLEGSARAGCSRAAGQSGLLAGMLAGEPDEEDRERLTDPVELDLPEDLLLREVDPLVVLVGDLVVRHSTEASATDLDVGDLFAVEPHSLVVRHLAFLERGRLASESCPPAKVPQVSLLDRAKRRVRVSILLPEPTHDGRHSHPPVRAVVLIT